MNPSTGDRYDKKWKRIFEDNLEDEELDYEYSDDELRIQDDFPLTYSWSPTSSRSSSPGSRSPSPSIAVINLIDENEDRDLQTLKKLTRDLQRIFRVQKIPYSKIAKSRWKKSNISGILKRWRIRSLDSLFTRDNVNCQTPRTSRRTIDIQTPSTSNGRTQEEEPQDVSVVVQNDLSQSDQPGPSSAASPEMPVLTPFMKIPIFHPNSSAQTSTSQQVDLSRPPQISPAPTPVSIAPTPVSTASTTASTVSASSTVASTSSSVGNISRHILTIPVIRVRNDLTNSTASRSVSLIPCSSIGNNVRSVTLPTTGSVDLTISRINFQNHAPVITTSITFTTDSIRNNLPNYVPPSTSSAAPTPGTSGNNVPNNQIPPYAAIPLRFQTQLIRACQIAIPRPTSVRSSRTQTRAKTLKNSTVQRFMHLATPLSSPAVIPRNTVQRPSFREIPMTRAPPAYPYPPSNFLPTPPPAHMPVQFRPYMHPRSYCPPIVTNSGNYQNLPSHSRQARDSSKNA